ncbi:hypothetical protein K0M31_017188 [Melipona bicolor]|uniref:Uncharacterized protein n=1 Tax=Melipona bicolor TaxID=60889 RepID=A0AA40G4Q4_9HYME|nr:hypothetical protein K0M31_017188 [Melipona bicolor]
MATKEETKEEETESLKFQRNLGSEEGIDGGEAEGEKEGGKQLAWQPISPRHASGDPQPEGKTGRCSRGEERRLPKMNLHEYIDIPLE